MANDKRNRGNQGSTEGTEQVAEEAVVEAPTEQPTEGGEGTESTTKATEAPAKPAGPSPEELFANLREAVSTAIAGADEEGVLPADSIEPCSWPTARSRRLAGAASRPRSSRRPSSGEGVNHAAVASVLEEMTKAPETKPRATRAAKPEVPAHITLAASLTALDVARLSLLEGVDTEVASQAIALAEATLQTGIEDEEARNGILAQATKAVNAVRAKARKSGQRRRHGRPPLRQDRGAHRAVRPWRPQGGRPPQGRRAHGDRHLRRQAAGRRVHRGQPDGSGQGGRCHHLRQRWAFWNAPNGKPVGDLRKA